MAVGVIRAALSAASGSSVTAVSSFTFTLGQAGDAPKGILVLVFQGVANADAIGTVTYGGTNVPAVSGGRAQDTATEPGSCETFFLGSGVPSGAPTGGVVVNCTSNTTTKWAVGILISAAADTEVPATIVLTQENAAVAEQSVDDGSVSGTNSLRFAGVYYGGATPAPAGTNSTVTLSTGITGTNDQTAYGWTVVKEAAAGIGSRLVGCTNSTSDDLAGVHLAVRETSRIATAGLATATGTAQPATVPATSPALELSSFGSFSPITSGATITDVTATISQFSSSASMAAPTYELWDAGTAIIGTAQTGTASTSSANVDTVVFTGVTYAQLGTLRLRIYAHSGTAGSGATLSVDSASLTVRFMPGAPAGGGTAGLATATGTAQAATVTVATAAGLATATGTALNATVATAITAPATLATATGTALNATAQTSGSTTATAGLATATGTAQQTAQHPAGAATATGTAQPGTVTVTPGASLATATATSQFTPGTSVSILAIADTPVTATATALNATVTSNIAATAGLATAAGTAQQTAQHPAGAATATGTALNATVSTSGNTVATAGLATATGTAQPATVTVRVTGTGLATATGTADQPSVSTSGSTTATAGLATATGTAAGIGHGTVAGLATATAAAQAAALAVLARAAAAQALAAALNASVPAQHVPAASTATVTAAVTSASSAADPRDGTATVTAAVTSASAVS